jgi:hypothetical protein
MEFPELKGIFEIKKKKSLKISPQNWQYRKKRFMSLMTG